MMTEKKLIAEFKENFYKTFGYYPLVFTRNENAIPYMSLEELKKYFEDLDIDIVARGSKKGSIDGRCIFSYIAKEMDYTLAEIGRHMGNRDHTTVRHTLTTFHNMIDTQEGFKSRFEEVYLAIKERKEKENGKIHQM